MNDADAVQIRPDDRGMQSFIAWGDQWGLLLDPFGIRWAVMQPGPQE